LGGARAKGSFKDPSASAAFTVTVNDVEAPLIFCGSVGLQTSGVDSKCSAVVPDVIGLVRTNTGDNCTAQNLLTITQNPAAGATVSGAGEHPITATVTDQAGNSSVCIVPFRLIDYFTPVFVTHPPVAALIADGQTCGVSNYKLPVASDPCGAQVVCMPPPGFCFPAGVTKVTCTATNPDGHQGITSFNVIGTDTCCKTTGARTSCNGTR
jgi:hypothetical protein